jgi:hypothetical protein
MFNIQGTSITLTGNVAMDINGATTAGTDYDQIINSTTGGLINVTGVSLNVIKGSSYSPSEGDIIQLLTCKGALTGPFAAISLPSSSWALSYSADGFRAEVKYSTSTNDVSAINSKVKIYSVANDIVVSGVNGEMVSVYTVAGKLLMRTIPSESISKINVSKGFYIVSVGGSNCKVLVP